MDPLGLDLWNTLLNHLREKEPFSPFLGGGIEIKATCGSVPTPKQLEKKGQQKPGIGDERIGMIKGYDWKAHHRETNNLLGLLWDFIDGKPRIVACFYSPRLKKEDWGEIIQPRAGGGRTTSVSIMSREGVRKMYEDWLFVVDDPRYIQFIDNFNKGSLIGDYKRANSSGLDARTILP